MVVLDDSGVLKVAHHRFYLPNDGNALNRCLSVFFCVLPRFNCNVSICANINATTKTDICNIVWVVAWTQMQEGGGNEGDVEGGGGVIEGGGERQL